MRYRTQPLVACLVVGLAACGRSDKRLPAGPAASSSQPSPGGRAALTGAGATFPNPIYTKWFDAYAKQTGVRINYQSIGSGGGIRQFTEGTVDFGATDGPMTDEQIGAAKGNVVHLPTVIGAVVLTYNLPRLGGSRLKLDGPTIAAIYSGEITNWNDSRIGALNPGMKLPNTDLIVVHRADGSGTTYVFTDYLSKVAPRWASAVGKSTAVKWPIGLGGKGNEGVTQQVKQTEGAIGYVELLYATSNNLAYADVKNAAGAYATPSIRTVSAAAAGIPLNEDTDFRVSITNPDGAESYPIASLTWLLVRKAPADPAKHRLLKGFLEWMLTPEAQRMAADLGYAPLPVKLIEIEQRRIAAL
ncbi:MAG TPA: phosphate ABC transporter substrate-binding protein PstS [Gemmatimonadales bacterium]|nr:phosphate ABC transporter substrate-binding protein PstS [Gemmatimonadales bacterium]